MHELTIAQELLELIAGVAREHGAVGVSSATVEIGELATVDPAALEFAFEAIRPGTPASACRLLMRSVPLVVRCSRCAAEGRASRELLCCPSCGGRPVAPIAGRELRLVAIEIEE